MNTSVFLLLLALGGFAIAFWVDHLFPQMRPGVSWRLLVYLGLCYVVAGTSSLTVPFGFRVAGNGGVAVTAALIIAFLFLVAIWALRAAAEQMSPRGGGGLRSKA